MKHQLVCLLLILLSFSVQAQEKWDLRRAVDYAIANNISIKQADLQTRFSALNYNQEKLSRYPTLSFQSNLGYRFGRSENPTTGVLEDNNFLSSGFQLQTSVDLFNWFSKKYSIESSRLNYEADKAQVKKAQDDIALNVAVAYLQILLAKEQAGVASIQVEQSRSQLEMIEKKVAAGVLPELSAAEMEAQLARDSSTLITAQASIQSYLLQMKALLNLDAAAPFDVVVPPVDMIPVESLSELQPEYVYQLAIKNLPQQQVNALRLEANQAAVKSARGSMFPVISAYGSLGSNFVNIGFPEFAEGPKVPSGATVIINGIEYDVVRPSVVPTGKETTTPFTRQLRNNFGQSIGLALTVPIFNGGVLRTNWERSKLNVMQTQLTIENDNQVLKQDIYQAYTDAVTALQRFNANKKTVEATRKAYEFALKRYNLNLVSTYDLLNSQNNLTRAQIEMLNAQYDYVFKMKLLEFYKGQGLKL